MDQTEGGRAATQGVERSLERGEEPGVLPLIDPLAVSLAPRRVTSQGEQGRPPAPAAPRETLDAALVMEVVQRVSWGGDRRRGVARLELGGALEGVVIVVEGEGREVGLEVSLPPGHTGQGLGERISARLAARGLAVRALTVR